jgi:hypothetical protein
MFFYWPVKKNGSAKGNYYSGKNIFPFCQAQDRRRGEASRSICSDANAQTFLPGRGRTTSEAASRETFEEEKTREKNDSERENVESAVSLSLTRAVALGCSFVWSPVYIYHSGSGWRSDCPKNQADLSAPTQASTRYAVVATVGGCPWENTCRPRSLG